MPAAKQIPFWELIKKFGKSLSHKKKVEPPKRLILIIMGNTLDKSLSKECKKDVKVVKNTFEEICDHYGLQLCSVEVLGKHYGWDNLYKAINTIPIGSGSDVVFLYYTGHGFSYANDRYTKYPQLDMRPPNKKVKHDINFVKHNTINLENLLTFMRFRGLRINIAIADCCNTVIDYKRPKVSTHDMWAFHKSLPPKSKTLTKALYNDDTKAISIIISSSQFGQPSVTDSKIGSLFTHFFSKAITSFIASKPKGELFIPWLKILKKASTKAFKESRGYDVGGGVAGKQKAVFQVYVDDEE